MEQRKSTTLQVTMVSPSEKAKSDRPMDGRTDGLTDGPMDGPTDRPCTQQKGQRKRIGIEEEEE